jgi:hypothetical protein
VSAGSTGAVYLSTRHSAQSLSFPRSAALEQELGVRFSRVVVVGDGGLVQLSFVVMDPDKATQFEASLSKPPAIVSEARPGGTTRVSVMKQGHNLTAGQTYYLVYENTRGAIRPGERVTIRVVDKQLRHVPVLR